MLRSELSLGLTEERIGLARPEVRRYFVAKLIVMSTATFAMHQIYWFYKNWKFAKERGEHVIPLLRAIFGVLFAYFLFKEVVATARAVSVPVNDRFTWKNIVGIVRGSDDRLS